MRLLREHGTHTLRRRIIGRNYSVLRNRQHVPPAPLLCASVHLLKWPIQRGAYGCDCVRHKWGVGAEAGIRDNAGNTALIAATANTHAETAVALVQSLDPLPVADNSNTSAAGARTSEITVRGTQVQPSPQHSGRKKGGHLPFENATLTATTLPDAGGLVTDTQVQAGVLSATSDEQSSSSAAMTKLNSHPALIQRKACDALARLCRENVPGVITAEGRGTVATDSVPQHSAPGKGSNPRATCMSPGQETLQAQLVAPSMLLQTVRSTAWSYDYTFVEDTVVIEPWSAPDVRDGVHDPSTAEVPQPILVESCTASTDKANTQVASSGSKSKDNINFKRKRKRTPKRKGKAHSNTPAKTCPKPSSKNEAALKMPRAHKTVMTKAPAEWQCTYICLDLLQEPVELPCCGKRACLECVRNLPCHTCSCVAVLQSGCGADMSTDRMLFSRVLQRGYGLVCAGRQERVFVRAQGCTCQRVGHLTPSPPRLRLSFDLNEWQCAHCCGTLVRLRWCSKQLRGMVDKGDNRCPTGTCLQRRLSTKLQARRAKQVPIEFTPWRRPHTPNHCKCISHELLLCAHLSTCLR